MNSGKATLADVLKRLAEQQAGFADCGEQLAKMPRIKIAMDFRQLAMGASSFAEIKEQLGKVQSGLAILRKDLHAIGLDLTREDLDILARVDLGMSRAELAKTTPREIHRYVRRLIRKEALLKAAAPVNKPQLSTPEDKLSNPEKCPALTISEAATLIGRSKGTIQRLASEGKLKRSRARGRVTTISVANYLKTDPES